MSADIGWELLSRIVQYGGLKDAMARRLTAAMLPTDEQQSVFRFIQGHYKKYRATPSVTVLAKKFPKGQFSLTVEEPTAYYLDNVVRQYLRAHGSDLLEETMKQLADDPMGAFERLRQDAGALLGRGIIAEDIQYGRNWKTRWDAYQRRRDGELLGIPTPWPTWNEWGLGWQPEQYIVVTARPGVGKTWFLLVCAHHAVMLRKNVLFFTKEMSIQALERRLDAMRYHLPYNAFRRGQLTPKQEQRYLRGLKKTRRLERDEKLGRLVFSGDAALSMTTIEAKIEEYHPDMVFIDGLYLLTDVQKSDADHERVRNISHDARSLTQRFKLPLMVSSQIHRMPGNLMRNWRNLTLGDLAFSDALGQDADEAFALIRTEEMRQRHELMVRTLKMREEEPHDWGVSWNLGTMRRTFHEIPLNEAGNVNEQVDRDPNGQPLQGADAPLLEAGAWDRPVEPAQD